MPDNLQTASESRVGLTDLLADRVCSHGFAGECVICSAGERNEWPRSYVDKEVRCTKCGASSWWRNPGDRCRISDCDGRVEAVASSMRVHASV